MLAVASVEETSTWQRYVIRVVDINKILGEYALAKMTKSRKISELWSRSAWAGPFGEHGEHCHGEGHC